MLSTSISYGLFAQASVVAGSTATTAANYSVGNGNNRVLVVSVTEESDSDISGTVYISGITWGGQALTLAVGRNNGGSAGNDLRTEIWYLKEADIAAATNACNNFVITWNGGYSTASQIVTAYTLKDVDQTITTVAATATAAPAGNGTSATLPSTAAGANDIVCYTSATRNSATHTPANGYTELTDVANGATSQAVAYKKITAASNEAPQASWTGGNTQVMILGVVFNGIAATYPATFYSYATGAWNANTSWSYSADGSSGAVPANVWPGRFDNVVIRSGHNITIDDVGDNKACGISPDALGRVNVGPVHATAVFYHTGDLLINGTLTVTGVGMMTEGYTHVTAGGTFAVGSTLVNLGYLETDASASLSISDDLILTGNSATFFNSTGTVGDDLVIDFTDASLCGSGVTSLTKTLNGSSRITYLHTATVAQICAPFQVTCTAPNCTGAPATGTGTVLQGNSGPGGVGNSANNKLWLKAGDLSLANNAAVTSWADVSGNNLIANATGAAATRPTFNTNSVNAILPSISFDGGDFLNLGNEAWLNFVPRTNSWSFICAFNVNTGSSGTFLSKATSDDNNKQYQYTIDSSTPNRFTAWLGGDFHTGAAIATSAWTIGMSTTGTNATTGFNTYLNGVADLTGETVGDGSTQTTDVLIGARRNNSATDFGFPLTGRIAEIAMYNAVLNTAQRMIITNYLAAKYAIVLAAANDMYTMDNTGNGNFDFEVAGIGQASDGSNHRDGKGSGIVRMWNASDLANSEFLMWGHDNTELYSSTTSGVGAPIEERLSRTWRVDKSGDVGTVSVSFDLDLLGTPLGSNLRLLIDRDGDGFADNDVSPVVGSFVDNTVVFNDVNFQDGDRFTLGNTDVDDPLPVELTNFRGKAEKHIVYLNWTTASETNNDFFTVERSKNSRDWEVVRQVPGAGTTRKENYYEVVDDGPYSGASYYRLKQTDFDLQSRYSDLVRVVVDHESPVMLYPNPFHDRFRILADFEPEGSEVKLYNSGGLEVPLVMTKEGEELIIEPGNVPQGLYILKVLDRFVTRTIKVVKVP